MISTNSNFLTGSDTRPDYYSVVKFNKTGFPLIQVDTKPALINACGILPIVSTITGGARTIIGLAHIVNYLAYFIFDGKNRSNHLKEIGLGGRNIAKGLAEMLPIIGNIFMVIINVNEISNLEHQIRKLVSENLDQYKNFVTTFADGKEVSKTPF